MNSNRFEPRRKRTGNPMNILCVTNMYPTEDNPAYGVFVKEQVDDLRAAGLQVDVVAFDARENRFAYVAAVRALRQKLGTRTFDLVHAHYGLTGAIALTQRRLPVVTTFHGGDYTGQVPWQLHVSRLVARRTLGICVSSEGARRLGCRHVIPVGVDPDLFRPLDPIAARRELGWDEKGIYVISSGSSLDPVKRADLFEAAVAAARNVRPQLKSFTLAGLTRREVSLALNAADVMLVTSDWEGAPVAIKESIACMTPVVSVRVGDVPATIEGLPGCALEHRDPEALARGVLRALDVGKRPELRLRAEEFSRTRIAERISRVFTEALEGTTRL